MKNRTILKIRKTREIPSELCFVLTACECYAIDWGDGTMLSSSNNEKLDGTFKHYYRDNNEYIVTIYDNSNLKINVLSNHDVFSHYGKDVFITEVIQISELITNCSNMFSYCKNLKTVKQAKLPIGCEYSENMFCRCEKLCDIISWGNVSSLENASYMYCYCSNIKHIKDNNFPFINNASYMFLDTGIEYIKNVNMNFGGYIYRIFNNCDKLENISNVHITANHMDVIISSSYINKTIIISNASFTANFSHTGLLDECRVNEFILDNVDFIMGDYFRVDCKIKISDQGKLCNQVSYNNAKIIDNRKWDKNG